MIGSLGNTSSAAPATLPQSSASLSAASSTSSPRAQLIDPHAVAHLRERLRVQPTPVSGVFGRWIVMKSACA